MKTLKVKIIQKDVKHARISLKSGNVILILPPNLISAEKDILEKNKRWIFEKLKYINKIKIESKKLKIVERNKESLEKLIAKYVDKFKEYLGVEPKFIRISKLKVRWGYCSLSGKLVFNELLKNLPAKFVKYVVFHEMCHLIIRNHYREFWNLVETRYPDHREIERKLDAYWWKLIRKSSRKTKS